MERYHPELSHIKDLLRSHPRGMTIIDISQNIGINRNSVAKYLDVLLISGQVEMHAVGTAKLYFLSKRVPISAMLSLSSDYVIIFDNEMAVQYINQKVLAFERVTREEVMGTHIDTLSFALLDNPEIREKIQDVDLEREFFMDIVVHRDDNEYFFRAKIIPTIFEGGGRGISVILVDNTPQKQYELTLEKQKTLYQAMVEDQTELISRWQPDGTHIYVNDAYCRYFQKEKPDIIGKRFRPSVVPEDSMRIDHHLRSLTSVNPVASIEQRTTMPDGSVRWQQFTDRAFFDDHDNITEYLSVGRDITNRKILEKREKETLDDLKFISETAIKFVSMFHKEEIFRYIGESIRTCLPESNVIIVRVYEQTHHGTVSAWFGNDDAPNIVGEPFEVDEHFTGLVYASALTELSTPWVRTLIKNQGKESALLRIDRALPPKRRFTMKIVAKDAFTYNLLISLPDTVPMRKVELIETIVNQASVALRRCLVEKELRIKENAIRSSIDGICICNRRWKITYVNPSFLKMFGYADPAEVQGKSLFSFFLHADILENNGDRFWQEGGWKGELTGIRKDRSNFYAHISGSAVDDQQFHPQCLLISLVDVTKRMQNEMSRGFLAAAAELSDEAIIGVNTDQQIISWNPAAEQIFGYAGEEVLQCKVTDLVPPEHHDRMDKVCTSILSGEEVHLDHAVLRKKNGDTVPFRGIITPVKDYKAQVYGATIMGRDLSGETLPKDTLVRIHSLQQCIEEHAPVCILKVRGGVVVHANPYALRLFEKPDPGDVIGKGIDELVKYRDVPGTNSISGEELLGGVTRRIASLPFDDGSESDVVVTIVPGCDRGEEIIFIESFNAPSEFDAVLRQLEDKLKTDLIQAIEVIGSELGSKNRIEEGLRNEIALHQTLIDALPDCVFFLDTDGNLLHMNAALRAMLGVQSGDVMGTHYETALHGFFAPEVYEAHVSSLLQGSEVTVDHAAGVSDGERLSWKTRLIPFTGSTGQVKGVVGISYECPLFP